MPRPDDVLCCDNCHPELLDRTRPGVPPRKKGKGTDSPEAPTKGDPDLETQARLEEWRDDVFASSFADSLLPRSAVLEDDLILLLSAYGRMTYSALQDILADRWIWWSVHGRQLSDLFLTLPERERAPAQSQPSRRKGRKSKKNNDSEAVWEVCFKEPRVFHPPGHLKPISQYTWTPVELDNEGREVVRGETSSTRGRKRAQPAPRRASASKKARPLTEPPRTPDPVRDRPPTPVIPSSTPRRPKPRPKPRPILAPHLHPTSTAGLSQDHGYSGSWTASACPPPTQLYPPILGWPVPTHAGPSGNGSFKAAAMLGGGLPVSQPLSVPPRTPILPSLQPHQHQPQHQPIGSTV